MGEFLKKINGLQRNNRYYILFGIQVLCIAFYMFFIKDLEKPAGLIEAIKFCFMNPGGYFIAILVGIVAWLLSSVLLMSNLMEIPIIKDILDYNDYYGSYGGYGGYEAYEDVSKIKMIVNIVLCIIAFILNALYLSYLITLIGLLIILMVAVYIFTQ